MNKSPENSLPLHILKCKQVSPRSLRLYTADSEGSRSIKYLSDHLRLPRLSSQESGNGFCWSKGRILQMQNVSTCGAWGSSTSASRGGRNKKNYSESVVSACILNPLKKVLSPKHCNWLLWVPPRTQDVAECTLPLSNGNSPDKNKDFQISSQPRIREGYLG